MNEPWSFPDELQNRANRLFDRAGGMPDMAGPAESRSWFPAVDIKEEDDHFAIVADVPGIRPQDIHITTEGGVLTIVGERYSDSTQKRDRYFRVERGWGKFERRFTLPETVDADHIQARSENGVLAIVIPKKETARPRRIQVTH